MYKIDTVYNGKPSKEWQPGGKWLDRPRPAAGWSGDGLYLRNDPTWIPKGDRTLSSAPSHEWTEAHNILSNELGPEMGLNNEEVVRLTQSSWLFKLGPAFVVYSFTQPMCIKDFLYATAPDERAPTHMRLLHSDGFEGTLNGKAARLLQGVT